MTKKDRSDRFADSDVDKYTFSKMKDKDFEEMKRLLKQRKLKRTKLSKDKKK